MSLSPHDKTDPPTNTRFTLLLKPGLAAHSRAYRLSICNLPTIRYYYRGVSKSGAYRKVAPRI